MADDHNRTLSDFEEKAMAARGAKRLGSIFTPPKEHSKCLRCKDAVYQTEKVCPRENIVFHKRCFSCSVCGITLALSTYYSNQADMSDIEIYCSKHCPRVVAPTLGPDAMSIKRALNAPKTENEPAWAGKKQPVNVDLNAMYIRGPLDAQKLQNQRSRSDANSRHHYPARYRHQYPPHIENKRREVIEAQKALEEQLRVEEDEMIKEFQEERTKHTKDLTKEIDIEWESRLKQLTKKYENMAIKNKGNKSKNDSAPQLKATEDFENEKRDLEKTMTLKRLKKKQVMTLHLIEKEQKATSSMVKKHSVQMLNLLYQKKEELKNELKKELERELERKEREVREAKLQLEKMTDSNQQSIPIMNMDDKMHTEDDTNLSIDRVTFLEDALEELLSIPGKDGIPQPAPPSCRKRELYRDPSVFSDLDDDVIKIAENEQVSYTDLVHQLTEYTYNDLEKARAIYRWITVKDLNVMEFEETIDSDTPMGLLRGIKYGTETYHTLFMRLCSYAGIPCEEIKGHSKSVGYEPGMKIKPDSFQNTWNAILINGDWRLVQCNWGARHLVLNKDKNHVNRDQDQIRYQYDEHYFLTDPDEFIQEFWPYYSQWQLLHNPITLTEFENLPFVRSVFFHHRMKFEGTKSSVLYTNDKGCTDITIRIPEEYQSELVFYYQLRYASKDRRHETTYKSSSLERFVYQTMLEDLIMFSIHVPMVGEYYFEIFANKIFDRRYSEYSGNNTAPAPFRLKCACKFKIVSKELNGKLYPLPNCASGEWGPKKAYRHFHIVPLYEQARNLEIDENVRAGIIYVNNFFKLKFAVGQPLQFVAKLRMNHVDDHVLDPYVRLSVHQEILTIHVKLPQPGQYGLDIYARPKDTKENHILNHACKYLINCSNVDNPVKIPKNATITQNMKIEKWGATAEFEKLGLKTMSHNDPLIRVKNSSHVTVEVNTPSSIRISYQFIREKDEDDREYVSMVRDKERVRFYINMPKAGNYMLSLYACGEESEDDNLKNVYNYLVQYTQENDNSNKLVNGKVSNLKLSDRRDSDTSLLTRGSRDFRRNTIDY